MLIISIYICSENCYLQRGMDNDTFELVVCTVFFFLVFFVNEYGLINESTSEKNLCGLAWISISKPRCLDCRCLYLVSRQALMDPSTRRNFHQHPPCHRQQDVGPSQSCTCLSTHCIPFQRHSMTSDPRCCFPSLTCKRFESSQMYIHFIPTSRTTMAKTIQI